jgi:hypothetical protein
MCSKCKSFVIGNRKGKIFCLRKLAFVRPEYKERPCYERGQYEAGTILDYKQALIGAGVWR